MISSTQISILKREIADFCRLFFFGWLFFVLFCFFWFFFFFFFLGGGGGGRGGGGGGINSPLRQHLGPSPREREREK